MVGFTPALLALHGCGTEADGALEAKDASLEAVFLHMSFEGELLTDSTWGADGAIEQQLLYTVGQLNGEPGVSRLDAVELTDVVTEQQDDGRVRVTYKAMLPVAWGKDQETPETYTFVLPRDMGWSAQQTFTDAYKAECVDWHAHDVDVNSLWYYWRPLEQGCTLKDEDVVRLEAAVKPSGTQTTGKYPEYHKVWEDQQLRMVAIFGKVEDGATTSADQGIDAYNDFVTAMADRLEEFAPVSVPAQIPSAPGVENPNITFEADLGEGRSIRVDAILVDNVREAGPEFDTRYEELSAQADFIAYNGHAGLGANIRALAAKGEWQTGQYVIVFMNGCDTYAYVDDALLDAHAAVNEDDEVGTKYVDTVVNAMPAYFVNMDQASLAFVDGLLSVDAPKTYEQIFADIDDDQIVLVTGEHDNEFTPAMWGIE